MNQKTNHLKTLTLLATASLGFATSALAQDPMKAPLNPAAPVPQGLLGSTYAGVAWNYYDLRDGPPSVGRGATAYFNEALADNLDLGVGYDWARTTAAAFSTAEQKLDLSLTGYSKQTWGKPFVTFGIDHAWRHGNVVGRHGSWGMAAETGVEFQVAPALVVSPFIGWDRETSFSRNDMRYGVRTTYRVSREWSVTGTAQLVDLQHTADYTKFSVGVNYHF